MRRKVSHMLLCAVIALLSGWAGHWLGSRKRSIVRVPETVVRHDTIRPAIPEPEVIVREVPTEVDTAAILADYFSEKHYLDTIIERPYLKVELTDVISRNSLLDRTVVVDYRSQWSATTRWFWEWMRDVTDVYCPQGTDVSPGSSRRAMTCTTGLWCWAFLKLFGNGSGRHT